MQARNTMTQGLGFNRMTAAAAGIALLAASALGAATLHDRVELPLIGGSSEISAPATNRLAEMKFIEANVWELEDVYIPTSVEEFRFIEANTFDFAVQRTMEEVRFLEANDWDYAPRANLAGEAQVAPKSVEEIRFLEQNVWDYAPNAQPAGDADVVPKSIDEIRFLEANIWNYSSLLPHGENGQTKY